MLLIFYDLLTLKFVPRMMISPASSMYEFPANTFRCFGNLFPNMQEVMRSEQEKLYMSQASEPAFDRRFTDEYKPGAARSGR